MRETAGQAIVEGRANAVAFERMFIATPDLPERFRREAPFIDHHRPSFYGGDALSYTDYPALVDPLALG